MSDPFRTFRDPATGLDYFVGDDARELLKRELAAGPTADTGAEVAAKEAAARATVDGASQFGAMTALAGRVITDGAAFVASVVQQKKDLKESAFAPWFSTQQNAYASALRGRNGEFETLAAGVASRFPAPAMDYPVTSVDAMNLNTRIHVFEQVGPDQAPPLVEDAIQRDDRAALTAYRVHLVQWPDVRNAWKGAPGSKVAADLVERIDAALAGGAGFAATYAAERVADFRGSWTYLLNILLAGDGGIDPMQRQAGALSPLLEPLAA